MANSYVVIRFEELRLGGQWRLDWGGEGQARYKPREGAIVTVTMKDGSTESVTPADNDVVVVEGDVIHIPTKTNYGRLSKAETPNYLLDALFTLADHGRK